jgi:zinc/manganese transport system substrate-binding protein
VLNALTPMVVRQLSKRGAAVAIAVCVVAAGCGGSPGGDGSQGEGSGIVLATTSIWADVVSEVACGSIEVGTLMPPGADPHAFEASLADRGRLDEAALVVANGLGLEGGVESTLSASQGQGTRVLRLGQVVDGVAADGDPHIWYDPAIVRSAVGLIADELVAAGLGERAAIDDCAATYIDALNEVDTAVSELVEVLNPQDRVLVTNHDALGYFASRYGFEVLGTVIPGPSTLAQTSPAQLEALADLIIDSGTPALFVEQEHSDDDARALASRVGDIEVVTVNSASLNPAAGASTNIELLKTTAEAIVAALSSS